MGSVSGALGLGVRRGRGNRSAFISVSMFRGSLCLRESSKFA